MREIVHKRLQKSCENIWLVRKNVVSLQYEKVRKRNLTRVV